MPACSCIAWCDKHQLQHFFSGLPSAVPLAVLGTPSPWSRLAAAAYQEQPPQLDLRSFGFFTLPRLHSADGLFDTKCDANRSRSCAAAECSGWQMQPPPPVSLSLSKLAPWPWSKQRRITAHLWSVEHKVLFVGPQLGERRMKVKLELSNPNVVSLWRTPHGSNPAPHPNHSWLEVFRTRRDQWNVAEGVAFGCWFYPLLRPYSKGSVECS